MTGEVKRNIMKQTKPIKMIAIDLDDTLLRDDTTVSAYTVETIQKARQKGIHIVIATGRMYGTAKPYGELLQLGDIPMMLFGGGLIQTLESKRKIFSQPIPKEATEHVLSLAKKYGWTVQSYIDDVLCVAVRNEYVKSYEDNIHCHAVEMGDDFYYPQGLSDKLLALGPHDDLLQVKVLLEEEMGDSLSITFSKPTFLEIGPKGVSKGKCLQRLCSFYGITLDEVMAFGNGLNDISMIEAAGMGFAVSNAAEEVKKRATYMTASNNDDGVAKAIETYIL